MNLHRSAATMAVSRRPRRTRQRQAGPVTVTRVDPRVWRTALRLAGRDLRRIRPVGDGSVIVRNA